MDRPALPGSIHHTSGSSVSKGAGGAGAGVQQSGRKRKGSTITATPPTAAVTGTKKGRTAKGATATVTVETVTKPLSVPSIPFISSCGSGSSSGSAGLYEVVEGLLGQGILPFAAAACPQV